MRFMKQAGSLTTEYTAWCGAKDCGCWIQRSAPKSDAIERFEDHGWKKVRGKGWVCPGCIEGLPLGIPYHYCGGEE